MPDRQRYVTEGGKVGQLSQELRLCDTDRSYVHEGSYADLQPLTFCFCG